MFNPIRLFRPIISFLSLYHRSIYNRHSCYFLSTAGTVNCIVSDALNQTMCRREDSPIVCQLGSLYSPHKPGPSSYDAFYENSFIPACRFTFNADSLITGKSFSMKHGQVLLSAISFRIYDWNAVIYYSFYSSAKCLHLC